MARKPSKLRVAVVTGSRAEFGLLVPVIRAIKAHKRLSLQLVAVGSHFLAPARTIRDVEAQFAIAARVPMQRARHRTRIDDARATARGIDGFTRAFARLKPDWVVILGDRIEAFAAASAAAIAGIAVAHIHGGDRAEGIADESMRHAITKLAHLHLAATKQSGERIVKMGERAECVHVVGSPAIDGLFSIPALNDREVARLIGGRKWRLPELVILLHPSGLPPEDEENLIEHVFFGAFMMTADDEMHQPVLTFAPNFDAGREVIERVRRVYVRDHDWAAVDHLPRPRWVGLLKWMARKRVPLMGNSSAGLIECAALGVPVINLGPRQAGRERDRNVIDLPVFPGDVDLVTLGAHARRLARRVRPSTRFGDGKTGPRIARLLASTNPHDPALLRKRNSY